MDDLFLRNNLDCLFVFGDNVERRGKGGVTKIGDEPNTYGFIMKKQPLSTDSAFSRIPLVMDSVSRPGGLARHMALG